MSTHQPTTRSTSLISPAVEAGASVRSACNGIKRMVSLAVAGMLGRVDRTHAVQAGERMALDLLRTVGFDITDSDRVNAVMPMVMEATSLVLADAAKHAPPGSLDAASLEGLARRGAQMLGEIARSRVVAAMVEPAWPSDIDAVIAIRISAASAMSLVAVEVAEFDFMHPQADCIKEAGKLVVQQAMAAAAQIAPKSASSAVRATLVQSLLQSSSRLYAAAWRAVALDRIAELDAMEDAPREARLEQMADEPLRSLLAPVNERFKNALDAVVATALQVDLAPEAVEARELRRSMRRA